VVIIWLPIILLTTCHHDQQIQRNEKRRVQKSGRVHQQYLKRDPTPVLQVIRFGHTCNASLTFLIASAPSFIPRPIKISRISFQDKIFTLVENNSFHLLCPAKDKYQFRAGMKHPLPGLDKPYQRHFPADCCNYNSLAPALRLAGTA